MKRLLVLALVGAVALGVTGLAQALGTPQRPIIMLFVPSVKVDVIQEVGPKIAQALSELTGLVIKPVIAPDYAAFIETMIAAQGDTFGVPTTDQYARITLQNPGVHCRLAAVRYGYHFYFTSIYALREKGYTSIKDLDGKVWAFASKRSTSGYVLPSGLFKAEGIQPVELAAGTHVAALIAVLEGQADFCTGYGSPPEPPENCCLACAWMFNTCLNQADRALCEARVKECCQACTTKWDYGMDPELWLWDPVAQDLWPEELRGRCVDLRWAIATEVKVYGDIWDLVRKVGVVATVGPIPNDSIAFAAGFPADLEEKIVEAIEKHIRSPEGYALWSRPGFYEWTDVVRIDDSYYDAYRLLVGLPVPQR